MSEQETISTLPAEDSGIPELIDTAGRLVRLNGSTNLAAAAIYEAADTLPDAQFRALIRLGAQRAVQMAANGLRNKLTKASWSVPAGAGDSIAARMQINGSTYDWPMPGGAPIGDATVADLDSAMELHRAQIAGHKKRFDFYARVHDKLVESGAATVRAGITESELAEMERDA